MERKRKGEKFWIEIKGKRLNQRKEREKTHRQKKKRCLNKKKDTK